MLCPFCKKEFTPSRTNQIFCCMVCKDGWHNAKKAFAVILCERAFGYVKGITDGWNERGENVTVSEVANTIILKQANADGEPLRKDELYGVNGDNH